MTDFRVRPRADFIQETDWQALYALTNHWKSDLLFYKDDLKFLHHLIDKYFIWITQKDNLDEVQKVGADIEEDSKECKILLEKTNDHLSHLAQIIENPAVKNPENFRDEHQMLEDEIAFFVKRVRENRKQLFSVTENVLESEQLMHLMKK